MFICHSFCVFCCYQISLIHYENNEEYTKYNTKNDGCCGLHYHLFNNDFDIFEILIRYSMTTQQARSRKSWLYSTCGNLQKGKFLGTIKGYFENNSDSQSWYDNLLSQCFSDYEKS